MFVNSFRGYFVEYLLERDDVKGPWKEYTEHDFVRQLALGTLSVDAFRFYMIQDYLYLVGANPTTVTNSKAYPHSRYTSQGPMLSQGIKRRISMISAW